MKVRVHSADPLRFEQPPTAEILIERRLPRVPHGEVSSSRENLFRHDAHSIAEALVHALPGGTVDALIVELLSRTKCELKVSYPAARGE